jgi:hypothetical protein
VTRKDRKKVYEEKEYLLNKVDVEGYDDGK